MAGRSVVVGSLLPTFIALLLAAAPAWAEPPPIGSPIDHFAGRHTIGEEGLLTLGDGNGNTPLKLRRLSLKQETPAGDPAPPDETVNPPQLTGSSEKFSQAITSGPTGFVQADLDQVILPSGERRPSLEPGFLVAGKGIATPPSGADCSTTVFCLTWFRPRYDSAHKLSTFVAGEQVATEVNFGEEDPDAGTDVAVATGTFTPGQGESVVVAWVHTPAGGTKETHFAHFTVGRDSQGRVSSLQPSGIGGVLGDTVTSPSIAVGDFAGTGSDQAAIVWGDPIPGTGNAPRISAALFEGSGGSLQPLVYSQQIEAPRTTNVAVAASRTAPGAVAQHDIRDNGSAIDHLIVGPGVSQTNYLYRLDLGKNDSNENAFEAETLSGPAGYATANSELDSLGDLDGDGLDELLATPFYAANPNQTTPGGARICYDATGLSNAACGRVEILDFSSDYPELGTSFTVDSTGVWPNRIESAVIDARPTKDQRIAPAPDSVDVASLPQVAVSGYNGNSIFVSSTSPYLDVASIDADEKILNPQIRTTISLAGSSGQDADRRPPRIATLALDGQVELGDPVQNAYTSLEPSVILNAPPTHFDVLGDRAYDPNFCYAGNQYLVPPVCFFDSEYERASSTSTEVSTESTEDWGVSAKVNVDADFGVAQLGAELRGGYGQNFSEVNGSTETETVTVNVKARNTDKIYAIRRAYDTLEYPLYQPGASEPEEYLLATTPHTLSQRWIDSSSPAAVDLGVNHEPGNILSYPEDLSTAENPFISPTEGTDAATKTTFGRDEFELSDSSDYNYTLTKSKVDADSAATTKRWNVGATISGGGGIGIVNVKAEVSADYSKSDLSNVATTIGDDTKLQSTMAGIDESFGETAYTVKPFAYWSDSAALVLDYAVEPSVAPPGSPKTWWQLKYGVRPDLTLNLPRLLDFEKQAGISSDAARFISPGVSVLRDRARIPRRWEPTRRGPAIRSASSPRWRTTASRTVPPTHASSSTTPIPNSAAR